MRFRWTIPTQADPIMTTLQQFRAEMEAYRQSVIAEALATKEMQIVPLKLVSLYSRFDENERLMASVVLSGWLVSQDESLRYDALAVIRRYQIVTALPALNKLLERLRDEARPGAPYEAHGVEKVIAAIASQK
jgi:hypothetical protein